MASTTPRPPIRKRIAALREQMRDHDVAAYVVPSTDPHQSEYLPKCWQRRPWISGFTGSAGDVVITSDAGGLWTDGRYYAQAKTELRGSGINLFKAAELDTPSQGKWLAKTLERGQAVGYDPRVMSLAVHKELSKALEDGGVELRPIAENLVDNIWQDRPEPPVAPVVSLARKFTGETTASKLKRVRKALAEGEAHAHVVTTLDSIAWLFNIRGSDVDFNPVSVAYAVITADIAILFVDKRKIDKKVVAQLKNVEVREYNSIEKTLRTLGKAKRAVWLDPSSCNTWVRDQLKGARIIEQPSPILGMKARKNVTEIEGMRNAHIRDGAAVARFLAWLETEVPKGGVTEMSAATKLAAIRAEGDNFRGLSFRTISGYAGHGAIIHYSVNNETSVPLKSKGIYLVDSGGQYLDGTTDITRTVLLGKSATREQKDRFTRVLKGHIGLARAIFPAGVSGIRLDTLARQALWDAGLDYGHGTGHGVGAYLNVHEGPQSISVRGYVPLELGNIMSNEPGFYQDGEYGIRIENLILVRPADVKQNGTPFFQFETLTLCPIDTRLIELRLLTDIERTWFNNYHKRVHKTLAPLLSGSAKSWLKRVTRPI